MTSRPRYSFPLRRAFILSFLLVPAFLLAREISPAEASRAARTWLRRAPAGAEKSFLPAPPSPDVRTELDADGRPLFHLVRLDGAIVVTAADDAITPVIAFLGSAEIPPPGCPFWEILRTAMASRRASVAARAAEAPSPRAATPAALAADDAPERLWAELLSSRPATALRAASSGNGLATIPDLRVAPLIRSRWGQDDGVYNHLTPSNYVCGCVATAMAQVMRYHRYPERAVVPMSRHCRIDGRVELLTTTGGRYDWEAMDLAPDPRTISEASRLAIAHLCRDVGISCYMNWTSNGSSAAPYAPAAALKDFFGYANAVGYTRNVGTEGNIPDAETARLLCSNLDAGLPVILGIKGHAVIGDGYGYDRSLLYVHLNMGWDGLGDLWYNLPHVTVGSGPGAYVSETFGSIVYNISPTNTGVLLTGRVTDHAARPLPGVTIEARSSRGTVTGTSGDGGLYALWVEPGDHALTATTSRKRGSRAAVSVPEARSTDYVEFPLSSGGGLGFRGRTGSPGNLAGADILLYATDADPLPVVIGGDGENPLSPGDGPGFVWRPDGVVIRFRAPEGSALYTLQATDDLSKPFRNIGTTRASHVAHDLIELSDPLPRGPSRFYRVLVE